MLKNNEKESNSNTDLSLGSLQGLSLTDGMFDIFANYVYKNTGIVMNQNKKTLLGNRLRKRLKALNLDSYEKYWKFIQDPKTSKSEIYHFLDAVSTNETYFQRGTSHYDILKNHILPKFIQEQKHHIRIWSAGCSTGEEPYDIAIIMNDFIEKNPYCQYSITASDISQEVLDFAKKGEYYDRKISKLSTQHVTKYFEKVKTEDSSITFAKQVLKVKPIIKKNITFRHHNLIKDPYFTGMDVILCRNVMIYFDRETQIKIVNKFAKSLNKNGILFIGHSETVQFADVEVKSVRFPEGTAYQRKEDN
ncbi:MAG: protein-glutamate O-methyltransferase CheR [Spirochaetia bacterium]|nr:protein-glutamate O-methyltransferase CheR [Spirochaetia bacterium]